MKADQSERGRPRIYNDADVAFIEATGKVKLQKGSDRRAIINRIMDAGGKMSLKQIDDSFGYDIREKVIALVRAGWLRVESKGGSK